MTGSFRWGGGFCAHLDRSRQTGSRHSTIFAKNYSLYEKTNYCSCSRSTDACGFLILQAKRDSACCVVTGANHPVIKTVWDRTTRRPTSRSALSDARPAWAYGSPRHTQRLCFPHCPLLTCPHHEHTATSSTRPMIFLWACSCASGAPTSHTAEIWVLFSSIVK